MKAKDEMSSKHPQASQAQTLGRAVIKGEQEAIASLLNMIDEKFDQACETIMACRGRLIVTGMGKSGIIGRKIASTMASCGTPSFFVHPGEASHGDLGMITRHDCVLALSFSGETQELIDIIPMIKQYQIPLISICKNTPSTLSKASDIHLPLHIQREACPLGLAPTSSTTATLVLGDALAIALLSQRGFTEKDFAKSHPGGSLGKRLLLKTKDVMHKNKRIPLASPDALLGQVLLTITEKCLGIAVITDNHKKILGVFTDGDLRRSFRTRLRCPCNFHPRYYDAQPNHHRPRDFGH